MGKESLGLPGLCRLGQSRRDCETRFADHIDDTLRTEGVDQNRGRRRIESESHDPIDAIDRLRHFAHPLEGVGDISSDDATRDLGVLAFGIQESLHPVLVAAIAMERRDFVDIAEIRKFDLLFRRVLTGGWIEHEPRLVLAPLEEARSGLVAEHALVHQLRHIVGKLVRFPRFVVRVLVDIVDDGAMDIPTHQIDSGKRRHRSAGIGSDQLVDQQWSDFASKLRTFIHQLEANAIASEAGRIKGANHLATEPKLGKSIDEVDDRRIRIAAGNQFRSHDHVRRIEKMQAQEILAEGIAPSLAERIDREPRSHRAGERG